MFGITYYIIEIARFNKLTRSTTKKLHTERGSFNDLKLVIRTHARYILKHIYFVVVAPIEVILSLTRASGLNFICFNS